MRHIIPISGKDSLTTAIVQQAARPELDYEYFYNVTEAELPEITDWLAKVEGYLGKPIVRVGENLTAIIEAQGILPSMHKRYCTRLAKIYPMERYIGDTPATLYFGLRADEMDRVGYHTTTHTITPAYPLQTMGIELAHVYHILGSRDLMPPDFFWQRLYDATLPELGFMAAELERLIRDSNPVWRYAARYIFNGRKRPNCFYCFNQQPSEFLWLLEAHPALFDEAKRLEETVGAEGYSWRDEWPLQRVMDEREVIFERRVRQCVSRVKQLLGRRDISDEPDMLSYSSCGVLCGK